MRAGACCCVAQSSEVPYGPPGDRFPHDARGVSPSRSAPVSTARGQAELHARSAPVAQRHESKKLSFPACARHLVPNLRCPPPPSGDSAQGVGGLTGEGRGFSEPRWMRFTGDIGRAGCAQRLRTDQASRVFQRAGGSRPQKRLPLSAARAASISADRTREPRKGIWHSITTRQNSTWALTYAVRSV